MRSLLLVWSCVATLAAQDDVLVRDLTAAVDLPTPEARRDAAHKLADRKDVTVDALLAAMKTFGTFPAAEPGVTDHTVPLWVGAGRTEDTQITVLVPRSYAPGKPAPLMLTLHGSGGSGTHHHAMWRAVSEALGMIVVSPTEAGANEGYAYTDRERNSALSAVRWARRTYNIDEARIFGTGISRGGHLLWDLATRHPDRFAAIAPMIGGPRAIGQNNLRYLENLAWLPIRDLQGSKDDPQLVWNVREGFRRLKAFGAKDAELIEFPELGHEFEFDKVDWIQFLSGATQSAQPARVVRMAARAGEGRAFWVEVTAYTGNIAEQFQPQVKAAEWQKIEKDEEAKRRFFLAEADKRTARLVVTRTTPGKFVAEGTGVTAFRLLLTADQADEKGNASVTWSGRSVTKKIVPTVRVLLREFVERFDRRFLPICELEVK